MKLKLKYILIGIGLCIALEFSFYKINHVYNITTPVFNLNQNDDLESHQGGGVLTNPLLECLGVGPDDSIEAHNISEPELSSFVQKTTKDHRLTLMSVYVRDLNNGPWIGINQDETFLGGSLLKVPMLISYLKLSETDPSLLKKEIRYEKPIASNIQYYSPSRQIEPGKTYTVEELLEYMIEYSDNNAAELLLQNIDKSEFDKVFISLGMGDPNPNVPYVVNTKTYAGFFRILYNASYLTKENSEKALSMLTKVEFNRGLQSRLPANLVVAHKFGVRSDGDVNQLHDCGIVYSPGNPYLVCVMSKGGTFDDMAQAISVVSEYVYDRFSK